MSELVIKTLGISIHVVRVDGHKMTKAAWRQIEVDDPFNVKDERIILLDGCEIHGWVNDDGIWWLYSDHGKLYRYKFIRSDVATSDYSSYENRYKKAWKIGGVTMLDSSLGGISVFIGQLKEKHPQLFIAT